MADLGMWGGLFSGLGSGLNAYFALKEAQDRDKLERQRLAQDATHQRRIHMENMLAALPAGMHGDVSAMRGMNTALDAPDMPAGGMAAIGNAGAPARRALQAAQADQGREAGMGYTNALQMAQFAPHGVEGNIQALDQRQLYPMLHPAMGGETTNAGPSATGWYQQDPMYAGPVTADVAGKYRMQGIDKQATAALKIADLRNQTSIAVANIRSRGQGSPAKTITQLNAEINDTQQDLYHVQGNYPETILLQKVYSPERKSYRSFADFTNATRLHLQEQALGARLNSLQAERDALTQHPQGYAQGAQGGLVGPRLTPSPTPADAAPPPPAPPQGAPQPPPPTRLPPSPNDPQPGESLEAYIARVRSLISGAEARQRWQQLEGTY